MIAKDDVKQPENGENYNFKISHLCSILLLSLYFIIYKCFQNDYCIIIHVLTLPIWRNVNLKNPHHYSETVGHKVAIICSLTYNTIGPKVIGVSLFYIKEKAK